MPKRGEQDCGICMFHGKKETKHYHVCEFLKLTHDKDNCVICTLYFLYKDVDKTMIFIKRHQEDLMQNKSKAKPFKGNKCTRCFLCIRTEDFVKKSKEHEKTCISCDFNCNFCIFLDLSQKVINFKNDLHKKRDVPADVNEWLKHNRMRLEKLLIEVKNSQIARAISNINFGSIQTTTENFSTSSGSTENLQHVQMVKLSNLYEF